MKLDKKNVEEASEESAHHRAHNRNPPEVVPSSESKQEVSEILLGHPAISNLVIYK